MGAIFTPRGKFHAKGQTPVLKTCLCFGRNSWTKLNRVNSKWMRWLRLAFKSRKNICIHIHIASTIQDTNVFDRKF
jgi:hypothetical protein